MGSGDGNVVSLPGRLPAIVDDTFGGHDRKAFGGDSERKPNTRDDGCICVGDDWGRNLGVVTSRRRDQCWRACDGLYGGCDLDIPRIADVANAQPTGVLCASHDLVCVMGLHGNVGSVGSLQRRSPRIVGDVAVGLRPN